MLIKIVMTLSTIESGANVIPKGERIFSQCIGIGVPLYVGLGCQEVIVLENLI